MTGQPRPTTSTFARDLSGNGHGTSAEAALFYAHRNAPVAPMFRTEECVCGGPPIRAVVGFEAAAVDEHNATLQHQSWRSRRESHA